MLRVEHLKSERGASAILIAFAMVLLLGIAALVIDATGAGFNERRQDQTAADTAVMSGALGYVIGESDIEKVQNALAVARANLDTTYTDAEWQAAWESCVDPDIGAVDVGLPQPRAFSPMPNPFTGTGTLQCVSESSSFMRVVIPDQFIETSFGKIIGFDSLSTSAEAVARIETDSGEQGLIPFGIPGNASDGEACLSTNPSGIAAEPCQGPSAGGFGTINSEFFGDLFGTATCANPGFSELEQNIALGIDHFVDVWPAATASGQGVTQGSAHPGDAVVGSYTGVAYDQCSISGGVVEPQQGGQTFPPNTMRVDTGFPQVPVENGLISDNTYLGQQSRLQETDNDTQKVVKRRQGSNETIYELDDWGPWDYLVGSGNGPCSASSYDGNGLSTEDKVILFQQCLSTFSGTTPIFRTDLDQSPRFAWAPQYWHAASTSGTSWQPVEDYRMVFLGGLWFNCNAGDCGAVFYPDRENDGDDGEICDISGGGCALLRLDQLSAWILPNDAVPESIRTAYPGSEPTPFATTLYR